MPHPGHFIGSRDCGFFLNTFVGRHIVSTVGEYRTRSTVKLVGETELKEVPPKYKEWFKRMGFDLLGFTRFYETMVFKAKIDSENSCCPYAAVISGGELDFEGYCNPDEAYKGHLKMCEKWSDKK